MTCVVPSPPGKGIKLLAVTATLVQLNTVHTKIGIKPICSLSAINAKAAAISRYKIAK